MRENGGKKKKREIGVGIESDFFLKAKGKTTEKAKERKR